MNERSDRLLRFLEEESIPYQLRKFDKPAHHASQAAGLADCPLGAVVKSLVLTCSEEGQFLIALVSGKNKVDLDRLSKIVCVQLEMANPKEVYHLTGFEVGAVPPFGVEEDHLTVIDEDLLSYEYVWAAAGSQKAMIRMTPADLRRITQAQVIRIS